MMEGLLFFRLEIILFFTSLGYIFYYLGEKIYHAYFHVKKMVTPIVVEEKEHQKKIRLSGKEENYKKDRGVATKLTDKKLKRLIEIHKRVKMNASKGYIDTAKALIVEGLAIDKFHKELNIELANIYEKEKNYIKSEYIYRDLIDVLEDDFEILKRLGFSLAMQKKYFEAISIYKKAYKKHRADFEIVDILTNLNFEIEDYKGALKYAKVYLKEKPRDVEKMLIKGTCLEFFGKNNEALEVYNMVLNLQPYNTEVIDKTKEIQKRLQIL